MTDHDRENMKLDLEAERKWKPLNVRQEDQALFVGNVLLAIFILGNAIGLGLWLYHHVLVHWVPILDKGG